MHTLADLLEQCGSSVPDELLNPQHVRDACAFARTIPAAWTRRFGFECQLGDQPEAGFAVQLHHDQDTPPPELAGSFLLRARQLDVLWPDEIGADVWIEHDLAPTASATPGIFATPRQSRVEFAGRLVDYLTGQPMNERLGHGVAACIDALPLGATLAQVGLLLGRRADALRLVLGFPEPRLIPAYLAAAGWPADGAQVERRLDELLVYAERIVLQIDLTADGVQPAIGLETYFGEFSQPRSDPRWAALLDLFVEREWCVRERRDALLAFPGQSYVFAALPLVIARGLSHFKVIVSPGLPTRAKAYFGFAYSLGLPRQLAH